MNIYKINNKKFKSIYISLNYTMDANEKEISENSILAGILSKSCDKYKTQEEIEKYLYSLYGANFDINFEKIGDLYNLEFRIEFINSHYLPNNENLVNECINFLYEIIYNPNINNFKFDEAIVEREKKFVLDKIKSKKDDKIKYAIQRTEEIMCKDENFGIYIYGTEKEVNKATPKSLYSRYLNVLNNSCINVVISGNLDGYDNIDTLIEEKFSSKIGQSKTCISMCTNKKNNDDKINIEESKEELETSQSIITVGLKVNNITKDDFFILNMYNAILGTSCSSKLFQNVREKESLAYIISSRYYRFKDIIIIFAGIDKKNYDRTKQVIFKQIDDISSGNVTDEEFFVAKENLIANLLEWEDSKIALEKMLISNLFFYKNNDIGLNEMIEGVKNVKLQDIIEISKKINVENIILLGGSENE